MRPQTYKDKQGNVHSVTHVVVSNPGDIKIIGGFKKKEAEPE